MAFRQSMTTLVARLRRLIGDPAGASEVFSHDDLQDSLDMRGEAVHQMPLRYEMTIGAGGQVLYNDYYADAPNWEDGVVLQDGGYNTITPDVSDLATGHWAFTRGQTPPVYLTGRSYDLLLTAADVLEEWAGRVQLDYEFTTDGQTFKRNQQYETLMARAAKMRDRAARESVASATLVRADINDQY